MTAPPAAAPPEKPLLAIGLRLLAALAVSLMFATGKVLAGRGVHLIEILFYRQLFAVPIVCTLVLITGSMASMKPNRLRWHAARTTVGVIAMGLNFAGMILLPLAEATTIGFTVPAFATIFSAIFLKEMPGLPRIAAVAVGFIGVIVMARPDTVHLPMAGVAVALAAAVGTATVSILLRNMARTEGSIAIVFWFTLLSLPPLGLLMLAFGRAHDPATFALIALMGTLGGIAQLLLTSSLRWAPVAVVLPMDYSQIIWATLMGWLVWSVLPLPTTWAGAALIVASGLIIVYREHRRGMVAALRAQADADIRG